MPPPRKKESICSDKQVPEVQTDHELFLQAFEKPTQIYRYLRTRNLLSPIFLQRNLYYMNGRMSRSHKNRSSFKLQSLLDQVVAKEEKKSDLPGRYLNITFSGFHNKRLDVNSGDVARVDIHILKLCHKKRKEAAAPVLQASVGTQDVWINPGDDSISRSISIPTHNFTANNGHQVKSYVLLFRVTVVHDQENGEPAPKRRRISRNTSSDCPPEPGCLLGTTYGAELVVYDRHARCILTPGQYELVLQSLGTDAPPPGKTSPKKTSSWESIDNLKLEGPFMALNNSPTLKFSLNWNEENTTIEKPKLRPLQPLDLVLANNTSTKPKMQGVQSPEAPQLVLYQFVYNNNSRQQTEARRDFHCPWCSLNCTALYSLLKHLKLCHARFTFTYVPHPKGARIDVSLNECFDGSYAGNPQDLVAVPSGYAFSRTGPTRRTPTTTVLVCRPKRNKPSLSEFLEQDDNDFDLPRSYILGHNRLYHHTSTCLAIQAHELDEDSEGEHDSGWVRTKTRMMIDDFSDVNDGEKEVMKLWNLHVMRYNFVGDCQIPLACTMFLENHGSEILKRNLYRNFVLHLVSLNDFGLIGSGVIYKCINKLQKKMEEESIKSDLNKYWEDQSRTAKRPFFSPLKIFQKSVQVASAIPCPVSSPNSTTYTKDKAKIVTSKSSKRNPEGSCVIH